jgi:hypothetical protein
MSWDIYGNTLRKGYCEVHPHVQEEYPCSLCYAESRINDQRRAIELQQRKDYEHSQRVLTLTANIEETLYDWIASHSLQLKKFRVETDKESDTPLLYFAKGEFHPCLFDKDTDGKSLEELYLTELAHVDERFSGTNLFFISDTEFKVL